MKIQFYDEENHLLQEDQLEADEYLDAARTGHDMIGQNLVPGAVDFRVVYEEGETDFDQEMLIR